jgi:Ala-tRNA(Pro) deacylase
LELEPGSVSPFGLLNNIDNSVETYIDEDIYNADIVSFHPNRNTATLELSKEMFRKYLDSLKHKIQIIKILQY